MGNENTVFTSTKLFADARNGRLESVRKGLKAAADFDLNEQDKETGQTALIAASSNNLTEIVKLLVKKKIDPDIQDMYGLTALHAASFGGFIEIVELLLKKKANLNLQDEDGNTPLHCASIGGHKNVVHLLLQAEADPTLRNKSRLCAWQVAKNEDTRSCFGISNADNNISITDADDSIDVTEESPVLFTEANGDEKFPFVENNIVLEEPV